MPDDRIIQHAYPPAPPEREDGAKAQRDSEAVLQQEKFSSIKSRIAQALYVLGGIAGLGLLVAAPILFVAIQFVDGLNLLGLLILPIWGLFALAAYGTGWAVRWIIDGTSTSIFDGWIERNLSGLVSKGRSSVDERSLDPVRNRPPV